ncbi:membrane protein [Marivita cryptomonadis]|nr:membrane protein [Marivita cryptomonadis]
MARIARVAALLDSRFRVPVIGVRVGWDSILGVIPGIGDAVTTVPAGWMIWQGYQMGARKRTLARMGLNAGIDLIVGGVPIIGDLFDVAFKSHKKNLALLQSDMQRRVIHASSEEVAHG